MTSGQLSDDLRGLRAHGVIERIGDTRSYQITDPITATGLAHALSLTHLASGSSSRACPRSPTLTHPPAAA